MGLMMGFLGGVGKGVADVSKDYLANEFEAMKHERIAENASKIKMRDEETAYQREVARAPEKDARAVTSAKATARGQSEFATEDLGNVQARDASNSAAKLGIMENEQSRRQAIASADKTNALDWEKTNAKDVNKLARDKAMATHIVDPQYAAQANADGTVLMVDVRNPKNVVQLTNSDGKPFVSKNPEEMKAVTAGITAANEKLRAADTEYKVDVTAAKGILDEKEQKLRLEEAKASLAAAKALHERETAPYLAIINRKAGGDAAQEKPAAKAPVDPAQFDRTRPAPAEKIPGQPAAKFQGNTPAVTAKAKLAEDIYQLQRLIDSGQDPEGNTKRQVDIGIMRGQLEGMK